MKKVGNDYKLFSKADDTTPATELTVTAQAGGTNTYTIGKITTKDANTGALLTSVKVNNTTASINNTAKTVTVLCLWNQLGPGQD